MTGAVENRDAQVFDINPFGFGKRFKIRSRTEIEVDDTATDRTAGDLVHVGIGAAQNLATFGQRDAREGVRSAGGANQRAFERVEGDIDFRSRAGADNLARVEHLGGVAIALAHYDFALKGDRVERITHRLGSDTIGGALVAFADKTGGSQGSRFGRSNHFLREVTLHYAPSSREVSYL